jgi:hypothetical protein
MSTYEADISVPVVSSISRPIRYSRACDSYQDFLDRGLLQRRKLLNQGFLLVKLKSSLRRLYGLHLLRKGKQFLLF